MFSLLTAYKHYDPAAKSKIEILLLYPGVKALFFHRIAHALFRAGIPFFPRMISEFSRFITGIEIHPGAVIGKNCIMDHGMGIVIGETTIIGDNVILYQGIVLGGTKLDPVKRHPTLENNVVVGTGAKVLGNITLGESSRVGANSVVIENVPAHCTVVGIPARILKKGIQKGEELHHDYII